jgi:glycerol-3-phosphate acyltransferase PlsY
MSLLLAALAGALLGSIPFGLVLTRAAGLGDIRQIGSGNIGATNVLRTGNKALAAATLLLDAGKGAVAVLIAGAIWTDPWAGPVAGLPLSSGTCSPPGSASRAARGLRRDLASCSPRRRGPVWLPAVYGLPRRRSRGSPRPPH